MHLSEQFNFPSSIMARTHVPQKGQNLNFYLETHAATTHNTCFIRLRILPRNSVHYIGVWMTLKNVKVFFDLCLVQVHVLPIPPTYLYLAAVTFIHPSSMLNTCSVHFLSHLVTASIPNSVASPCLPRMGATLRMAATTSPSQLLLSSFLTASTLTVEVPCSRMIVVSFVHFFFFPDAWKDMINELELEEQQQQLDLATVLAAFLSTDHPTNPTIILNIKKRFRKVWSETARKEYF